MRKSLIQSMVLSAAAGLFLVTTVNAAQVPTSNLFYQNGAPLAGNVSIAVNNPQNMSGGSWVGSGPTYPAGGASPILDGNTSTNWYAGTTGSNGNDPPQYGMLNIAMTQGYYTDTGGNTFVNVPFTHIGLIRIYATEQPTPAGNWNNFAKQVAVAYTTNTFNPGNGYSYNSYNAAPGGGPLPGTWNDVASVSLVNGAAPTAPSDPSYSTADGWVATSFTLGVVGDTNNYDSETAYMDLAVDIPDGATSVAISFGMDNTSTGNQGGIAIAEVEAFPVPEPASISLIGLGSIGLLARRRNRVVAGN